MLTALAFSLLVAFEAGKTFTTKPDGFTWTVVTATGDGKRAIMVNHDSMEIGSFKPKTVNAFLMYANKDGIGTKNGKQYSAVAGNYQFNCDTKQYRFDTLTQRTKEGEEVGYIIASDWVTSQNKESMINIALNWSCNNATALTPKTDEERKKREIERKIRRLPAESKRST